MNNTKNKNSNLLSLNYELAIIEQEKAKMALHFAEINKDPSESLNLEKARLFSAKIKVHEAKIALNSSEL
jgi:hypothetical protein